MAIDTTLDGRYSLVAQQGGKKPNLIVFELDGERHVVDRAPIGKDHWAKWPSFFLEMGAKHLARIEAGFANAPDALEVLRTVPENAVLLATETEADEWVLRSRVAEDLAASLAREDAFQATVMFAARMQVQGFDDLFMAFKDRWRPSAQPTDANRLMSARKMAEMMSKEHPDWNELREDVDPEAPPRPPSM